MKEISSISKYNNYKSQKDEEDSFGFLKLVIKTEITIGLIIFIIICTYKLIPKKAIFVLKYNINKAFIDNYNKDSDKITDDSANNERKEGYNIIKNSIEKNRHLSDDEKKFIEKYLKDEINENYYFIDIEKVAKRLENLKIYYNKKYYYDEKEEEYKNSNLEFEILGIVGSYNAFFNKINIYEQIEEYQISSNYINEEFGFNSCNKEALFHELNHLLAKNSLNTITNRSVFSEIINELFTKEYYYSTELLEEKEDERAYDEFMMYAYCLAEILPDEVIRKYKFDNNESILIEGLLEIDDNIDKAYDLIYCINSLNIIEKEKSKNINQKYKKIHDSYKYFYEKKYNEKMENNINILLYFYNTPIQNMAERKIVESNLNSSGKDSINTNPKGYFSEKYKEILKNN